jgi:MraZ protein
MPLTGTYTRSLDEKLRLAVPKRLKEQFGEPQLTSLYVAPGTEHSLALYSPSAFESLGKRLSEQVQNPVKIRNYLRLFYSRAEKVDLDGQGRIRLPERLAQFAELQREVVILGVHDHAELWDRALWDQFLAEQAAGFDVLAQQAFDPNL